MEERGITIITILKHSELVSGDLRAVDWLVEGLIPAEGLVVIGGDAAEGKSWLSQHIAQCVAAGKPVFGQFRTTQGPVVYVDAESSPLLLKRRLQKLAAGLEVRSDIPVTFVFARGVRIDEEHSPEGVMAFLEREKPVLVIFDSLVRIHGANENDAREMAKVMANLRQIQTRERCAVLITHHTRKRSMINVAGQMLRGSSDIRAAVDGHIFLRPTSEATRKRLVHDKSRYSQPLEPFQIEIVDNEVGTATFVRYVGPGEAPPMRREVRQIARELIVEMLEEGRMTRPEIIDRCRGQAGERAVGEALRELYAERVLEREVGARQQHTYRLAEEDSGLSFGP